MFISDIGGSAGLILGISFLSIIKFSIQAFNVLFKKSAARARRAIVTKLSKTNRQRKISQSDIQKKFSAMWGNRSSLPNSMVIENDFVSSRSSDSSGVKIWN